MSAFDPATQTVWFDHTPNQEKARLDAAPGLSIADVDKLVREHYVRGRRDAEKAAQTSIDQASTLGRQHGHNMGAKDLHDKLWANVVFKVVEARQGIGRALDSTRLTKAQRRDLDRAYDLLEKAEAWYREKGKELGV